MRYLVGSSWGTCADRWLLGRRCVGLLLALVGLAFAPQSARAQPAPAPNWPGLDVAALYWVDESGHATLDSARAVFERGLGARYSSEQITPLGGGRAVWYRLALPPVTAPARAVLTIPYPGMDVVELYRPGAAGDWQMQRSGDMMPVADWPVRYLHPAFAFTIEPDEPHASYLRVQHSQPVGVQWLLWDARSFNESNKDWHLVLGGYVGFMVLVVLLSCTNALSWRDPIHFLYAVYVVLLGLSQLSLTGLAGEYFWPESPWWNDMAAVVLPAAAAGWAGVLVRELVIERGTRLLSWLLLGQAALGLLIAAGFMLIGRNPFFVLLNLYLPLAGVLLLATLAWFSRRRPKVGLWVLAGFAILAAGSMFPVLRNLGRLPMTFATQYGPQFAAALEIPLVLIGLYFRSRERLDNRIRIGALARTDPLTGVSSDRLLMERLDHLIHRHHRDPTLGAVMRIRLANGPDIRHEYGMEAAQAALVTTAECVAREALEGDTVARHKDGDFVLLLEGRVSRDQVANAGRNMIAHGLAPSQRLPNGLVLELQIACVCAPLPAVDAPALLGLLAAQLEEIDRQPGRALRFVGESGHSLPHAT